MSFKINGSNGETIAITDGDYYFNTKARGRRMMLNSLSSDARRVYACLELATMGFQQELAVKMEGGQKVPITPTDIKQQTGLLRQNVTRGLVELEDAGLALRQAPDGGALRKGQVLLYSWATPRQPKEQDCNRARLQFPDWFPDSWEPLRPLINRYKYSLIDDESIARDYIEAGAEAARAYKEAEIVAARILEKVCAGAKRPSASLYRKEQKEHIERTPSSSAVSSTSGTPKAEEEERSSLYQEFKSSYPAGHFDEPKAKPSFEKMTKTEQARILVRLRVYLTCDRWKDAGGDWIPLASNWLESYEADPPPLLKRAQAATAGDESLMERAMRIRGISHG